jgi:HAD superfamily hydrolase (TIGR01549 family)
MKPELLIFDLGRVLVDFDFRKAIEEIKRHSPLTADQIQHFFETTPLWDAYERGALPSEQFFGKLGEGLELSDDLSFDAFKVLWCDIFTEKTDTVALVDRLRKQYRLAILSNVNEMHWLYIRGKYDFLKWFELPIASYAVGLRKPEAAIYQHVLDKAGVTADKAVFTDDLETHIIAARALGIRAHQFTTADQLSKDIKDLL